MQTSLFIAKLIGPILVVAGLTGALNTQLLREVGREFLASPALLFIAGFMALLGGLAVVNTHNIWVAGWPVIITFIGWVALIAGVLRIGFPAIARSMGKTMLAKESLLQAIGVVQVLLGAFLMYKGYSS